MMVRGGLKGLKTDLERHGLRPIYAIGGDEPLLVQECCDAVRTAACRAGFAEREVWHVATGFDWDALLASANGQSLFGERKLLDLRMPNGMTRGNAGTKAIDVLVGLLGDNACLLVTLPKLESRQPKWVSVLEGGGALVPVWPPRVNELTGWLAGRLKQHGLQAVPDALAALAERTEGNLLAADQEIKRLALGHPADSKQSIDVRTIYDSVADNARFNLFGVMDAVFDGKPKRLVRLLRGLAAEGMDIIPVYTMVYRDISQLLQLQERMRRGESAANAARELKIFPRPRQERLVGVVRNSRFATRALQVAQRRLADLDRLGKGQRDGPDPFDELIETLLPLAGI